MLIVYSHIGIQFKYYNENNKFTTTGNREHMHARYIDNR